MGLFNPHQGSWGLPDFGITEAIGGVLGAPKSQQGGSNIIGGSRANTQPINDSGLNILNKGTGNVAGISTNTPYTGAAKTPVASKPVNTAPVAPPQGPSGPDPYMQEIDNAYGESYGYLDRVENQLRADLPNVLAEAENQFKVNAQKLGNSKDEAFNKFTQQTTQAGQRKDDALAAARRLYSELQRGYLQRFGGASSAFQAASEIGNVEQQRQFGQTNRDYMNTVNQIQGQRDGVEREYRTNLFELESQKQASINQANRDFQSKLLEIANNRAQLGQEKANMRLQALQELRNKIFSIQQQNAQFQQALEAQRQAALLNVGRFAEAARIGQDASTNTFNAFNPNITSNLQTSSNYNPQGTQDYTGIMRRPEDQYIGAIDPFRKDIPGNAYGLAT